MEPSVRFRRSPRLKDFDYVGPLTAHLVMVTRGRRPAFSDPDCARITLDKLDSACARFGATMHAYCLMPDHVHFLVSVDGGVSLQDFVRNFKQTSGYELKKRLGEEVWQISYYDHILRREEAMAEVAQYIWSNPVSSGLVPSPLDYPLSGPRELMG